MTPNDTYIKQVLLHAAVTPPEKVWVHISDSLNELKTDDLLRQNLLSAELTPPDDLWQKMALRFDDEQADITVAAKINEAEIEAPAFVWDAISNELDHELFAGKLNEVSVAPPVTAWQQIELVLDAEADQNTREKLLHTEAEAPAAVWNYIDEQINQGEGAKVIPFTRRIAPFYKLAAAAVITGVLAWGSYQLFSSQETADPVVQNVPPPVKPEENKNTNTVVPPGEQTQQQSTTAIAAVKQNPAKETAKQNKQPVRKQLPVTAVTETEVAVAKPVDHSSEISLPRRNGVHHKKNTSSFTGSALPENQYMLVLNDNGDLIKVSKKIATMKCANGSGEIPVDAVAALQTRDCDDQIKRWQQKIAMSTLVSPSAGYIDMNELILATEK